jgi:hypothetical protein
VDQLSAVLDSPEIAGLIADIEALRWTGRPGYGVRAMVAMMLAKSLYALATWSRTARLVAEHPALAAVVGCQPSQWACYRFAKTLREHSEMLSTALDRVLASLRESLTEIGQHMAIDASDLPAYANGQRFKSKNGPERQPEEYSDPDASWGHRSAVSTRKGGVFYGYRVHLAVDVATELPLAWTTETAKANETNFALPLIDAARGRGMNVKVAIMDGGYDNEAIHNGCMDRNVIPITPLRETPAVKRGDHRPKVCQHGVWTFAGADFKRKATKWRCPTGQCSPMSVWVKADRLHPLVPRESKRSVALYRSRGAVEREFGRLKNEWAMAPLRVRRIERVRLHVDLTMLAKLSCRLASERALALAA